MPRMRQIAVVAFIFLFAASTYAQGTPIPRAPLIEPVPLIPRALLMDPVLPSWLMGGDLSSGSSFLVPSTPVQPLEELPFSGLEELPFSGLEGKTFLGSANTSGLGLIQDIPQPLKEFAVRFKELGLYLLSSDESLGELGERVVIGRLDRFPAVTDSPALLRWQEEFEKGAMGALVGIDGPMEFIFIQLQERVGVPPLGTPRSNFEARWRNARREQRIFISYTGDDLDWAKKVKSVLDRHYVTFIYQNKSGEPFTTPQQAGKIFTESGHRYVIICKKSLNSGGVIFEHLLGRKLDNLYQIEQR